MTFMPRGFWIAVADARGAMILENVGTALEPELRLVERIEAPEVSGPRDRPGRMADPGPNQRSAMEATDRERLAETALAATLIARLDRLARRGAFERLALVAPPRLLGALRTRIDPALEARIVLQLEKTLTGLPIDSIAAAVSEALGETA